MEQWRDIPGYEGRYQVSDLGRVRSLDRAVKTVSRCGNRSARVVRGVLLAPQKHSRGYVQYKLGGRIWLAHALVALAFIGPRPEGMEVAHGDGDKQNNAFRNLRYATPLENGDDRRKHGTSGAGEANSRAVLSNAAVEQLRATRGLTQTELGEQHGISQAHVSRLLNRRRRSA